MDAVYCALAIDIGTPFILQDAVDQEILDLKGAVFARAVVELQDFSIEPIQISRIAMIWKAAANPERFEIFGDGEAIVQEFDYNTLTIENVTAGRAIYPAFGTLAAPLIVHTWD